MKKVINNLFVYLTGDEKNRPMVFIHGFPFDHTMWKKQIEVFSKEYYCVAYDIRGLGKSPADDGQFTMESFVDDLESIINELKLKKSVLCGLSMGGYISLRALERMPEMFCKAILCDTRSAADNNDGKLKRASGIKKINTEGLASFVGDFITNCFGADFRRNEKKEFENIIKKSIGFDAVGIKGSLIAMLSRTDTTAALGKIKIPVLLICGKQDFLTPPSVMREMFLKMQKAEFIEIGKAGHMTPIEKPVEVNRAIRSFLERKKNNRHE